jgi:predicted Ser/Thr protein kinase
MTVETNILPPRYRDPQLIGYGGMGEIYRAEDVALGRSVAVKVLAERYAQDESVRGRFTREALTAARLSGEPSTITIFDVGEHEQRPFIVMEYLEGGSLEERLRQSGAQDPRQALEWLEQAAAALDAAHRNGVVHRDVKPGNLLLAADGTVRVADFGVASAAGLDSLTVTGTVLGTAGYLAPEQAKGEATTPATDRYALAVVAFELLTGERPYQSDAPTAEAAAHVHAEIPAASERAPLPPEVDAVFQRALAKEPGERYGASAEFVAALRTALAPGTQSTRKLAPVAVPASRRGGLNPLLVVAAVLATLALTGAGLAALLTGDEGGGETVVTRVETQTLPGTTIRETVATTVQETTTATTATTGTTAPPETGGDGVALTDEATGLLQQGRWAEAESVAARAVAALEGSGNRRYLAYALYDLGRAQAEQGKCDAALPNLNRSEQLQGHRTDIDRARAKCGVR